jgi:pyruvate dehydrogenase (quinone)
MSTPNVSVFMLERLKAWGVGRVYGYPGDGTNGLNLAFHEVGEEIEFVQVRHEELAAFAACAHAKLTGEVGVCMATSGPGAIHLLNGLYDAKLDNAPVVAIVGQQKRMSLGGDFQQRSTCARSSRTWPPSTWPRSTTRARPRTWSIARCGSPSRSGP